MNTAPIRELVRRRSGLDLAVSSERALEDALKTRIAATGVPHETAYYAKACSDENEFYELVGLLTVNETYFFREPEQIAMFVDRLAPRLLESRREDGPVRILSAGSSTGEEAFSLAIALAERYPGTASDAFSIVGIDIDKEAVHRARAGLYRGFSFRAMDDALRERYFESAGNGAWRICDRIRRMADFRHFNILSDEYPEELKDFSAIFFRNVSIYFDASTRRCILAGFERILREDGVLLTGMAESMSNDLGILRLVQESGIFYFDRGARREPAAPPTACEAGGLGSTPLPEANPATGAEVGVGHRASDRGRRNRGRRG